MTTLTPEQWDLANHHIETANLIIIQGVIEARYGQCEKLRKLALGHLDIARNLLMEPVTDEMRAG